MKIPAKEWKSGYTPVTTRDDATQTFMDFGFVKLGPGDQWIHEGDGECAALLMTGAVTFQWDTDAGKSSENLQRRSIFDEDPGCLHVPSKIPLEITGRDPGAEVCVVRTDNPQTFPAHLYSPEECRSEHRGAGTMRETSTRIVRTIFDTENAPDSNLVLGEVINYPGKWSSYPPHHHPQPEIYHYRFKPDQGFGFGMLGPERAVQIHHGDTVIIPGGQSHSQTSAPGYAMYYIWVIRHLKGNPYGTPTFEPQHMWLKDPANETKIWPPAEETQRGGQ